VEVEHPVAGRVRQLGAPVKLSATPWQVGRAPLLGEHNEQVFCGELGLPREELVRLRQTGIV
jgi:formyl-CoA transferase